MTLLDATNVRVGITGGLYKAPVGSTAPTDATTALDAAFINLGYVSQEGYHLPMLNAVGIPEGVDDLTVRKSLLNDFGLEIGGGLGDFKGRAWRIGLMGHSATAGNVEKVVGALRELL